MPVREGSAVWEGDLRSGKGTMKTGSGRCEGPYSFTSRFENGAGTNPEELIGAAHAGCFSMAFSNILATAGFKPQRIATTARVAVEKKGDGFQITTVTLVCEGKVPGISKEDFAKHAGTAKENCPVSKLLKGAEIRLEATLG